MKDRFLGTYGFSISPSSLILSRAFSACAARPLCAPPESLWTISWCFWISFCCFSHADHCERVGAQFGLPLHTISLAPLHTHLHTSPPTPAARPARSLH